jgi:GntR family transcriptional regulator
MESGLEVLESIDTMAERIGLSVSMGELKVDHRPASPEEKKALELGPESQVLHLARVILAEGRPAAYLIDIIPDDILSPEDIREDFTGSVLDLFVQRYPSNMLSSRCEINAVTATVDVARKMGIQRGDVLLRFIAYLYTSPERVLDYSFSYFLPGCFRFHVVRRVG